MQLQSKELTAIDREFLTKLRNLLVEYNVDMTMDCNAGLLSIDPQYILLFESSADPTWDNPGIYIELTMGNPTILGSDITNLLSKGK